MSGIDVVKQALAAIEAGNIDKAAGLQTDDMKFDGPVPEPLGKKDFSGMMKAMLSGIPDWKFNAVNFVENGNKVNLTAQITGTQSKTLTLPMIPQPIAPTGKHISLPREPMEFTIVNNKISRIHVESVPGGGVMGILEQLGMKVPAH